jgi:hypothetical protein
VWSATAGHRRRLTVTSRWGRADAEGPPPRPRQASRRAIEHSESQFWLARAVIELDLAPAHSDGYRVSHDRRTVTVGNKHQCAV